VGSTLDGIYTLKEKVGQGGMAEVWLAEVDLDRFDYTTLYAYTQVQGETHLERRRKAEELARELADKELDLGTVRTILETQRIPVPGETVAVKIGVGQADLQRFEAEWKNLLCLSHENVIEVYGGGIHEDRPYYAMEYLENLVSPKRIKEEYSLRDKLGVIVQGGRGLAYLHGNGLIHRDVKPDNLVTCEVEPGQHVTKVTDLGLGKNVGDDLGLTMTNQIMGTPYYMSPEQITSTRDVDFRADTYSLGASLYELVTGYRPYHNKSTVYEIIASVAKGETPIPPNEHMPDLPGPLGGIIDCAMAVDATKRYQQVDDLTADLETYLEEEDPEVTAAVLPVAAAAMAAGKAGSRSYIFDKIKRKQDRKKLAAQARAAASRVQQRRGASVSKQRLAVSGDEPAEPTRSRKPLFVGIALVVVAVAAILFAVLGKRGKPGTSATAKAARGTQARADSVATAAPQPDTGRTPTPESRIATPEQLHAALKAANPDYSGHGEFTVEDGRIVEARLRDAGISDISALKGLRLRKLDLQRNPVADITPLKDMPLKALHMVSCPVENLSALAGMPLEVAAFGGAKVSDISALAGMPLRNLDLGHCRQLRDVELLKGMPLKVLCLHGTRVSDISPLRGLPLRSLDLWRCSELHDLRPLAECRDLEVLTIPEHCKDIEFLRDLPKLRKLANHTMSPGLTQTAMEFWFKWDAQKKKVAPVSPKGIFAMPLPPARKDFPVGPWLTVPPPADLDRSDRDALLEFYRPIVGEVKKVGFNSVLIGWRADRLGDRILTELARDAELRVILYPDKFVRLMKSNQPPSPASARAAVKEIVDAVRGYDNVIGYVSYGDPVKPQWLKSWKVLGPILHAETGGKPALACYPNEKVLRQFNDAAPVHGYQFFAYPFEEKSKGNVLTGTIFSAPDPDSARRALPREPAWAWVQACSGYGSLRMPTPAELRALCYLCIVHGARGLMFFHYKPPRPTARGLCDEKGMPTPFLREFAPMLPSIVRMGTELLTCEIIDDAVSATGKIDAAYFHDGKSKRYLAMASKDPDAPVAAQVAFAAGKLRPVALEDAWDQERITGQATRNGISFGILVPPGQGRLFRVVLEQDQAAEITAEQIRLVIAAEKTNPERLGPYAIKKRVGGCGLRHPGGHTGAQL